MRMTDDMVERQHRVLAELCELGLELARGLKARADGAETLKDAEGYALAFHRVSRSVRLTLALESKLAREITEIVRCEESRTARRTHERRQQVRAAVAREVWRETEGEGAEAILEALDERLEIDTMFEAFLDGPVEAAIARIREDLGLAANDSGAAPGETPTPQIVDWRSSA